MARIVDAYLLENKKKKLISLSNISATDYSDKFKGKLYCTTPNCSAKLSYVYRDNFGSHFRTWRESPHAEHCIYYFEKTKSREGRRREGLITGTVSDDRIRNSLRDAFALEMMTEEQRKSKLERDREKRRLRKERYKTKSSKDAQPAQKVVTNPDEISRNTPSIGFKLYKKSADALKESDIGQTRTVIGNLIEVQEKGNNALVRIQKKGIVVDVKFEEAFFAANNRYKGMFHYINRYLNDMGDLFFAATGEVRVNKNTSNYDVVVFNSIGFLIHGKSLEGIAAEYAIIDNDR